MILQPTVYVGDSLYPSSVTLISLLSGTLAPASKSDVVVFGTAEEARIVGTVAGTYEIGSFGLFKLTPSISFTATLLDGEGELTSTTYAVGTSAQSQSGFLLTQAGYVEQKVVITPAVSIFGPNGEVALLVEYTITIDTAGNIVATCSGLSISE
jgi:hypothetical protein